LKLFEDDNILDKIEEASEVPLAVFGASLRAWGVIKTSGLKPMSKKYIRKFKALICLSCYRLCYLISR